jgi:hypothetical protein
MARDSGYEVHVVTRIDRGGYAIAQEGFVVHPRGAAPNLVRRCTARLPEPLQPLHRARDRISPI